MIQPITVKISLQCSPDHAFRQWTTSASSWWPMAHTVSQEPGFEVHWEPFQGGRIFEKAQDGQLYDWGEVVVWDPPRRLGYLWHIARERSDATEVEITFSAQPDGTTQVDVVHDGWERLGDLGKPWRDRNQAGWDSVIPIFIAACGGW